eukprot:scaffold41153_cov46-Phaeocystis_antarctica.AAC.2
MKAGPRSPSSAGWKLSWCAPTRSSVTDNNSAGMELSSVGMGLRTVGMGLSTVPFIWRSELGVPTPPESVRTRQTCNGC